MPSKRAPKKPAGLRYRNLHMRGSAIYYERHVAGERIRFSTGTSQWDLAAEVRDEYEARLGLNEEGLAPFAIPTFGEFAQRYLEEDTSELAASTRGDLPSYLRKSGPLGALDNQLLTGLDSPYLQQWWRQEILGKGYSHSTGQCYVGVLSSVLRYAEDLGILTESPMPQFRRRLNRRKNTQKGRAERDTRSSIRPIEDPADLKALVEATASERLIAQSFIVLMLDSGMRMGEALGVQWHDIKWGRDENDTSRQILIRRSRARGGPIGRTKSGRERTVHLSRRLRRLLLRLQAEVQPAADEFIVLGIDSHNFRKREWKRVVEASGIGHRRYKDLRDTFASHLVSEGVPLPYVSEQLGHSDVAVTAQHYARWVGGDSWQRPLRVEEGEVPADLLARLL